MPCSLIDRAASWWRWKGWLLGSRWSAFRYYRWPALLRKLHLLAPEPPVRYVYTPPPTAEAILADPEFLAIKQRYPAVTFNVQQLTKGIRVNGSYPAVILLSASRGPEGGAAVRVAVTKRVPWDNIRRACATLSSMAARTALPTAGL